MAVSVGGPQVCMTKSELTELLAERAKLPRKRAEDVVNCVLEAIAASLERGDRIEVRGFGSFSLNEHRAYTGRNPRTGEEVPVDAKRAVHFKVGRELREAANTTDPERPKPAPAKTRAPRTRRTED